MEVRAVFLVSNITLVLISIMGISLASSGNVALAKAKEAFQSSQLAGSPLSSVLPWVVAAIAIIIDSGRLARMHGRDLHTLAPTTVSHLTLRNCCISLTSMLASITDLVMAALENLPDRI